MPPKFATKEFGRFEGDFEEFEALKKFGGLTHFRVLNM